MEGDYILQRSFAHAKAWRAIFMTKGDFCHFQNRKKNRHNKCEL